MFFLQSVLIWRKTRKRKPWTLSFIEEVWICRTGAIFQRFSVERRQARGERESESRARGGVKNKTTIKHLYPYEKEKKESGLRALFLFFNNKMEHPHVKYSLLLLIVLVTSKIAPTKLLSGQKLMWQMTNTT